MAEDGKEDIVSELEKQMAKLEDVQTTFKGMYEKVSRLKAQCDILKTERQTLSSECAQHFTARASLDEETRNRHAEREVPGSGNRGALEKDGSRSHYDQGTLIEFDGQGKLNRRIWLLEQRNLDLTKDMDELKKVHQGELQVEMATASGLRDRIGKLDERVRNGKQEVEDIESSRLGLKRELDSLRAHVEVDKKRLRTEWIDMKDAVEKEKKEVTRLNGEVTGLTTQRQAALEELNRLRDTKRSVPLSPRRVLQARSPNVTHARTRPSSPVTPTKANILSPSRITSALPDMKRPARSSSILSPAMSLAQQHAHLEDSHRSLKVEYDKLHNQYSQDRVYWKEWKAIQVSRNDLKREKRKARRTDQASSSGDNAKAPMSAQMPLVSASVESQPKEDSALPVQAEQRATSATVRRSGPQCEEEVDFDEDTDELAYPAGFVEMTAGQYGLSKPSRNDWSSVAPEGASRLAIDLSSPAKVVRQQITTNETPPPPLSITQDTMPHDGKLRTSHPSRVTPWLGNASPDKTRPSKKADVLDNADVFDRPGTPSTTSATPATAKAPLIRDRLGLTTSTSSLRRTALQKTIRADHPMRDSASPTQSSRGKRKLDMQNLSPAEKSVRLKELGKMPAAEKRELYAQYKGKGRYLPPEDVRPQVFDEYEIDPQKNEGAHFQFQDVKRRKTDRNQMHGGDCECCKNYYEAVGPLPKFNEGPAWKDPSHAPDSPTGDFVQEHQDKVSRHRETWRKAPTPPGFWQIAFPNTQDVALQNAAADQMTAEREAQLRRDAAQKDGKWRKKQ